MKVGLFFGSFNPIHIGHLIIAEAMTAFVDQVWFVVSPHNPFKQQATLAHEFDRIDMVRMAIAENERFRASDIEFHLPKPSYTTHTLAHLSEKHPGKDFYLILGGDNLNSFHKWKNYQHILEHYKLLVYPRPERASLNQQATDLQKHPSVISVQAPLIDLSATYIRDRLKNGQSVKYLICEEVVQFIRRKHLYQ